MDDGGVYGVGNSGLRNCEENNFPKNFQAIQRYGIDEYVLIISTRSVAVLVK